MITVDDKTLEWQEGLTIAALIESIDVEDARFCSVVRMNGKLVSSPQFAETQVPDNAVIQLLPLVAGG